MSTVSKSIEAPQPQGKPASQMLPMLPDIPLPALEFVDTCDGAPNCFTVIDTYSTTEVVPTPTPPFQ